MPRRCRSPLREPETWHLIATSINQIVVEEKMTKVMTTGFLIPASSLGTQGAQPPGSPTRASRGGVEVPSAASEGLLERDLAKATTKTQARAPALQIHEGFSSS